MRSNNTRENKKKKSFRRADNYFRVKIREAITPRARTSYFFPPHFFFAEHLIMAEHLLSSNTQNSNAWYDPAFFITSRRVTPDFFLSYILVKLWTAFSFARPYQMYRNHQTMTFYIFGNKHYDLNIKYVHTQIHITCKKYDYCVSMTTKPHTS